MTHDLAALLAEQACERLVLESAAHNDGRDWAALAELYTPDARLVRPSGHAVDGRDAIQANYQQGPADRRTRHVCTNIRVVIDGEDAASATTLVLIYSWTAPGAGEGNELPIVGSPTLGEFVDTFERGEDGWRISTRTARLLAKPDSI
jgi:ketosteroid isomerase-like protein